MHYDTLAYRIDAELRRKLGLINRAAVCDYMLSFKSLRKVDLANASLRRAAQHLSIWPRKGLTRRGDIKHRIAQNLQTELVQVGLEQNLRQRVLGGLMEVQHQTDLKWRIREWEQQDA